MGDTIKKIGIKNDAGQYTYTDIGVDADKVDIDNTTLDQKISTIETNITNHTTTLGNKVDKVSGKGLSTNDYTTTEKTKLSGIAAGAEVNQNAFANVVVGSTTIAADAKSDSLTLVAGSNVTITPDATNDKITIAATDTKYSTATTSAAGLMSAADKTKLDGIAAGATKIVVDTALSSTSTNPIQNKVVNTALNGKLSTTGTAAKATADANGNVIPDTYATKDELTDSNNTLASDIALNRQTLGYNKKNLFKVGTVTSTSNGITYTVNADKSITANGTATADSGKSLGAFMPTPNMEYIFTANEKVPTDGLWDNVCYIKGIDASDVWFGDSTGKNFIPKTNNLITCHIHIKKGTTVNNLTFYPMIRSAEITDATYEPYVDGVDKRLKNVETELGEIPNTYIPKKSILNSQEEIEANTSGENVAGALALKEINNNMGGLRFGVDADGNYGYYKDGADTVTPFKSGGVSYIAMRVLTAWFDFTGLKSITINSVSRTAYVDVIYEDGSKKSVQITSKEQIIDVIGAKKINYRTNDSMPSSVDFTFTK